MKLILTRIFNLQKLYSSKHFPLLFHTTMSLNAGKSFSPIQTKEKRANVYSFLDGGFACNFPIQIKNISFVYHHFVPSGFIKQQLVSFQKWSNKQYRKLVPRKNIHSPFSSKGISVLGKQHF